MDLRYGVIKYSASRNRLIRTDYAICCACQERTIGVITKMDDCKSMEKALHFKEFVRTQKDVEEIGAIQARLQHG